MNSKTIGEQTEAIVMAELLKNGFPVLIPFGGDQRYDLVFEKENELYKVQCKTGKVTNGCILFDARSSYRHRNGTSKTCKGEVDYFGIYCPQNKKTYLVPIEKINTTGSLRLRPTKNNQNKRVRYAKDYELTEILQ